MTKHRVENKEQAILDAAITVFAERGFWNTPTSLISRTAGVADGTLFNYFKTKDDLITSLYLQLNREVAERMLSGLAECDSLEAKLRHVWNSHIDWGLAEPGKFNVLQQISASFPLSAEVKAESLALFSEIEYMAQDLIAGDKINDYPVEYLAAQIEANIDLTIQFISTHAGDGVDYKVIGFDILWRGLRR